MHSLRLPQLAVDNETMAIIAGVALAVAAVVYFGVRFWMVSSRASILKDVKTPNVDRLNRKALEHMSEESVDQDESETKALEDEDAPADLKAIVPPDAADDDKNKNNRPA